MRPGHVNNVVYNRYAESARVNWALNFATSDSSHRHEWMVRPTIDWKDLKSVLNWSIELQHLMTPKSIGLILRSIKTDYKFVSTLFVLGSLG